MLLRKNINILKSLGLSQTQFPLIRTMFNNSEKLARNLQQIRFLKECISKKCFPNTINNLHLPEFFQRPKMYNTQRKLKEQITKSGIRFLYGEIRKCKEKITTLNDKVRQVHTTNKADYIIDLCKQAYHVSRIFHKHRVNSKLHHIISKKIIEEEKPKVNTTTKEDLVTDLTKELSPEEISLLAKGPKFAIQEKINNDCLINIQANFCRLAHQIRWHHKQETIATNKENNILPFPRFH